MPFGDLGSAKAYLKVAPKYRNIVEPYGDSGTLAMVLEKVPPKSHIVNYQDPVNYELMRFIQSITSADIKALKARDWVSSPENFDAAQAVTATEGADLYWSYFVVKAFGAMAKDPEQPMTWDWLTAGESASKVMRRLPIQRVALKKVTLTLDDPVAVARRASGADTWVMLAPKKPEDIEAIERVLPLSAPYLYAKKSKDRALLAESIAVNTTSAQRVSYISAGSVMPGTTEVRVNYDSGLPDLTLLEIPA